jgi:fused signal recognition particle receptor
MFKKLKEKFSSWIKKPESEKKEEKPAEAPKPEVSSETNVKNSEKISEKEKDLKKSLKEKVKEINKEIEQLKHPKAQEKQELPEKQNKQALQEQIKDTQPPKTLKTPKIKELAPTKTETQLNELEYPQQKPEEKQGFFTKLKTKLSTSALTQEQFDEIFPDLELTLLENNVALEAVDKIHDDLSKDLVGIPIKKQEIESTIITSLKNAINEILIEPPNLLEQIKKSLNPYTIIFVGINGSGKTTSVAKLAHYLKQNKISCVLAAADTFRAASIEQLKEHAKNLDIPIISHQYDADPAAVTFDAKKYAESHRIKAVLIDTAGRMYTKTNLIKEMEKIVRVSEPNLKIFVGESITGNDVIEQARTFNEAIDIDGIILSKADIDEKAGTILSVSQVTKKPIYFLGTGQNYKDLQPFTKETVLKNLGLE